MELQKNDTKIYILKGDKDMIKGAETIAQYKILKWIEITFAEGRVNVNFLDDHTARLIDINHDTMIVTYTQDEGISILG